MVDYDLPPISKAMQKVLHNVGMSLEERLVLEQHRVHAPTPTFAILLPGLNVTNSRAAASCMHPQRFDTQEKRLTRGALAQTAADLVWQAKTPGHTGRPQNRPQWPHPFRW